MALVITHHLTSWLAVAFLVVGALALHRTGQRVAARAVTAAAVVGVVGVAVWTPVVGHRLVAYLGPIFSGAASGIWAAIGHGTSRQLFHSAAGARPSPTWEIVVMLGAAVAWCAVLALSLRSAIRGRTVRGGQLRWIPVVIAAAYPVALLSRISSSSSEVGGRSMAFVFFGVAIVVGGWLATRLRPGLRLYWRAAILAIASVCFLGSLLFGSGPDWSLVPGRYLVGADQRSVSRALPCRGAVGLDAPSARDPRRRRPGERGPARRHRARRPRHRDQRPGQPVSPVLRPGHRALRAGPDPHGRYPLHRDRPTAHDRAPAVRDVYRAGGDQDPDRVSPRPSSTSSSRSPA